MARKGGNPDIVKNGEKTQFNGNRAAKAAAKSVEVRRENATNRAILEKYGNMKLSILPMGDMAEALSQAIPEITFKEAKNLAMLIKAANGDKQAADYCRDTEGEKPTDKVDVRATSTFEDAIDELIGRKTK